MLIKSSEAWLTCSLPSRMDRGGRSQFISAKWPAWRCPPQVQQTLPAATPLLCHTHTGTEGFMYTQISSWQGGHLCPVTCVLVSRFCAQGCCLGHISEVTTCDGESTMASQNSQQSPENAKHSSTSHKAQKEKMPLRGYAVR